ncbi:MAG: type II secretion system secretin GspD [Gammaproteobacteria bacterium]|nr:type II secretion system secretin GspD [Gammaproteobacteria bacterium]
MEKIFTMRLIPSCIIVVSLIACNTVARKEVVEPATSEVRQLPPAQLETQAQFTLPSRAEGVGETPKVQSPKRRWIVEIGTEDYVAQIPDTETKPDTEPGDITLNFEETDIREFIKVILGDVLNLNYIIDPQVDGTVTVETASPVKKEALIPLVEEILAINGAAIVETEGIYWILPKDEAVRGNLAPITPAFTDEVGYSVRIVPLAYIAAQEMQKILEPFLPEGASLRVDKQRNLLILGGTQQELNTLQETIDTFDINWLRGMSVGVYPLEYVDPKTLKAELDSILGGVESDSSDELLGGLVRTVPIERLNSLLLISSTANALREAEIWLQRLDTPGDPVGRGLYVYKVQNAKATELAEMLGQIFGTSDLTILPTPEAALAPGVTPVTISSTEAEGDQQETEQAKSSAAVGTQDAALPSGESIDIIADDSRNALVVLATPQDYKMVEAAIRKLDVVPLQVLIEASIIEVTLNDNLDYGVEWFFRNELGSYTGQGLLDLGIAGIGPLIPGFSYTIVNSANNVRFVLNALAEESEINVLSSPSLMVLDNQTATINVGDEIPVATRQSVSVISPDAPQINEITFRQTGVTLEVTPRVNNSGLVTLEIRQEVSLPVQTTTSTLDSPTIQNRTIETIVAVNSGETLILGGLIQETETNAESGIPVLYKIPILGPLFGATSNEARRTELIVLLTPRVARNRDEARAISEEYRQKLKSVTPIEQNRPDSSADEPS